METLGCRAAGLATASPPVGRKLISSEGVELAYRKIQAWWKRSREIGGGGAELHQASQGRVHHGATPLLTGCHIRSELVGTMLSALAGEQLYLITSMEN